MVDPAVYPYYQRLNQNPDDAEALFMLWQYHGDRGEFQQLATMVEQVASRRLDPASAADLFFRAGELWAKNVGRHDKAVGNYRRSYELDPGQIAAIEAARMLYLQLGNFKLAAQLFERQLGTTGDPMLRLPLLRELAETRVQMNDPSGQAAALEEVLKLVPDDYEAMRELAAAYLARAETPDGGDPDRMRAASLLVTIATAMGDEHALAFAESALDAWPGDEAGFSIVRDAYLTAGRGEDLAVRQIHFLSANPDSGLAGQIRKDLAEIYLGANQIDDAIAALVPLAPEDAEATRTLIDLYRRAGRTGELITLLHAVPASRDPEQRVADLREIAELSGQQGDRDGMLGALREILTLDPNDAEAMALVEDDLRARNAFDELRKLLQIAARAPHASNEARVARLREIARLSEQRLNDVPGALDGWRAVLSIDPHDAEAQATLDKLLMRTERWDDLARFLEQRAEVATSRSDRRSVLERLAELHRSKRHDEPAEADALRVLWDFDPDDDVSLRLMDARRRIGDIAGVTEVLRSRADGAGPAVAVDRWSELAQHLEQADERDDALQAWQRVATLDPSHAKAWDSAERLLERTGRLDLLIDTLIAHAAGPAAGERPAQLHARAADIARSLGDVSTALDQAEKALALTPDDDAVSSLLMDLLEATGQRDRVIALLQSRIARPGESEPKMALMRRLARVTGEQDAEESARLWDELRDLARQSGKRDDAEALAALMQHAQATHNPARWAELLQEAAAFATDPSTQRDLLVQRAALLANELARPDEALAALQDVVVRLDGAHAVTWAQLADVAHRLGRHDAEIEALERQLELTDDGEAKALLAGRVADLAEHALRDVARALRALEIHYDADPTDYTVVARLAQLYEQREQWPEVVKYLEVLTEVEGDDDELTRLLLRLAEIAEQKLPSARKAFDLLKPHALAGNSSALEALRGVAERGQLDAELIDVLSELTTKTTAPAMRATLWREIARRHETARKQIVPALDAWLHVVVARPLEIDALDSIERLARAIRQAPPAFQAFTVVLAALNAPEEIRAIALRGVAFLDSMGAHTEAFDLALAAQGRAPADEDLLGAIVQLAPQCGRGDEMFMAFDRRRNASRDDAERYSVMLRAARAAAVSLGDRATAFNYLRLAVNQATAAKAPDEARLGAIESMARDADAENPGDLRGGVVELYAALAGESVEDNPRIAALLYRRGALLCSDELSMPDQAYGLLTRAVTLWPADPRSADQLEAVARAQKRVADVVGLYQRVVDDAYDAATARTYQARRAALLGDELGRVDEAVEALRTLIEIAPKDLDALRMLQHTLRKHRRHQDLLMALERELEIGASDPLAVRKEIARVWESDLKNSFEAKDAWKRVLKQAADDPDARSAMQRLERKRDASDSEIEAPLPDERTEAFDTLDPDAVREASALEIQAPPPDTMEPETLDPESVQEGSSLEIHAPPPDTMEPSEAMAIETLDDASVLEGSSLEIHAPPPDLIDPDTRDLPIPPHHAVEPTGPWMARRVSEVPASVRKPLSDPPTAVVDTMPDGAPSTPPPTAAPPPLGAGHPEPTSERLAPDALEDLEALDAHDHPNGDEAPADELDAEPLEAEEVDEPSLGSLAAAVQHPSSSRPPPPPSPGRHSRPPPPPPAPKRD